jgi:hypothetical protein
LHPQAELTGRFLVPSGPCHERHDISHGDSDVTGGELVAAMQRKRSCGNRDRGPCHFARSYHFVIAVWRSKKAQFGAREIFGNHR